MRIQARFQCIWTQHQPLRLQRAHMRTIFTVSRRTTQPMKAAELIQRKKTTMMLVHLLFHLKRGATWMTNLLMLTIPQVLLLDGNLSWNRQPRRTRRQKKNHRGLSWNR
ncbi:hypothetical protein JG687_00014232 [Phytophthora cactorum]|uniref:Uncharacterized protein n=1 Tax=Phytophthora cactorum TaxID=29920 RepID=A0A8T1TX41_9STRA|nr:hypothetical protein JG687_00014232 [Phytophthora cactorum]